jgi:hypothetical protein
MVCGPFMALQTDETIQKLMKITAKWIQTSDKSLRTIAKSTAISAKWIQTSDKSVKTIAI